MLTFFWMVFWAGLTVLAFLAGVSLRGRLRHEPVPTVPVVDDAAVRAILRTGLISSDGNAELDMQEIDEEEERFWSESWEEPEEW